MDLSKLKYYQKMQLPLVKKIDEVCRELNIRYYLIGGTLLGAVRHGGYIPWDFDMDIAMPREDYEIFRKYWKNRNDSVFFYEDYTTDKHHFSPHALLRMKNTQIVYNIHQRVKTKYSGLYIDIFPLDKAPMDKGLQIKQAKDIAKIRRLFEPKMGVCYSNNVFAKIYKYAISIILSPISFRYLGSKLDRVFKQYNDTDSIYWVSMASHYSYNKQLMIKDVYGKPKEREFEGLQLFCPENTEQYLTTLFGNYMELPPEESRYLHLEQIKEVILK